MSTELDSLTAFKTRQFEEERRCCDNLPFACIISVMILLFGLITWTSTTYIAFAYVLDEIVNTLFNIDAMRWKSNLRPGLIIFALIVSLFAILVLIYAIFATGALRKSYFKNEKRIKAGKIIGKTLNAFTYIFCVIWLLVVILTMIPTTCSIMAIGYCEQNNQYTKHNQPMWWGIKLVNYGVGWRVNRSRSDENPMRTELVEKEDIDQFCNTSFQAASYFYLSTFSAMMVLGGLTLLLSNGIINSLRVAMSREIELSKQAFDR